MVKGWPTLLKKIKSDIKSTLEKPITTTIIILVVLSVLVFGLSAYYYRNKPEEYIESVLNEAHGMIFDLGIIGILLFWLNKRGEKRVNIKRCEDDIDDIRFWKSEEATYKIKGYIKRLNNNGVHKIELYNCYLKNVNLHHARLDFSNLNYADLSDASLVKTNFQNARMNQTIFRKASLNTTQFEYAMLTGAIFEEAKGVKTNFHRAKLIKANFRNAFFIEANFSYADLSGVDFENVSLYTPDFRHAIGIHPEIFSNVKIMSSPKFDEQMESQIRNLYPHLFKGNASNSQPPSVTETSSAAGMPGDIKI